MGGRAAGAGALATGGSFFGTAATDCGLAAVGAGFCGFALGLVIGRADFAAALGERGTICVRYAGVPAGCDPTAVPVRICGWDGSCIPEAASPTRVQMLQIVRENRTIAVLQYPGILI